MIANPFVTMLQTLAEYRPDQICAGGDVDDDLVRAVMTESGDLTRISAMIRVLYETGLIRCDAALAENGDVQVRAQEAIELMELIQGWAHDPAETETATEIEDTVDFLVLAGVEPEPDPALIRAWTPAQRKSAQFWAVRTHLRASDNAVNPGLVPDHVQALLKEKEGA